MNMLVQNTRFNELEIKNMMKMYTAHAKRGSGMNIKAFDKFWSQLTGIEHHPYLVDIFIFFDRGSQDRTIDFNDLVTSMNIIERGTFEEKV